MKQLVAVVILTACLWLAACGAVKVMLTTNAIECLFIGSLAAFGAVFIAFLCSIAAASWDGPSL